MRSREEYFLAQVFLRSDTQVKEIIILRFNLSIKLKIKHASLFKIVKRQS
jgi:hypothetical protein